METAEKFAKNIGADWTRVDLFLAGFEEGAEPIIKLNEVENVSGYKVRTSARLPHPAPSRATSCSLICRRQAWVLHMHC